MQRLHDSGTVRATLLVAPAGWGKTTLLGAVGARPARARGRIAWVSLDHADNEPVALLGLRR